jgi:hypothetical protein
MMGPAFFARRGGMVGEDSRKVRSWKFVVGSKDGKVKRGEFAASDRKSPPFVQKAHKGWGTLKNFCSGLERRKKEPQEPTCKSGMWGTWVLFFELWRVDGSEFENEKA